MPSSKGWRDPDAPRSAEPRRIGEVLAALVAQRAFARGMPLGRLVRRWEEVVGPRLAAETSPARLEAGTLVVRATSGPWGAQARFLGEEIRKRANGALGGEVIKRVQVVVASEPSVRRKPL